MLQEIATLKKRLAEAEAERDRLNAQAVRSLSLSEITLTLFSLFCQASKEKGPKTAAPPANQAEGKPKQEGESEDKTAEDAAEEAKNDAETQKQREEVDGRSVYVGNVDYATTPEELHSVFQVHHSYAVFQGERSRRVELWDSEPCDGVDGSYGCSKGIRVCGVSGTGCCRGGHCSVGNRDS